ncbi:MAG: hypothetical protein ABL886_08680 [Rhodoglobus sp.]
MQSYDLSGLRRELERRASMSVDLHDWDHYILGETATLGSRTMTAGAAARHEEQRWRVGRFPSVQLAIADAIFSKVRKYEAAVRNDVRPFAAAFGCEPLTAFAQRDWRGVYRATYHREPDSTTEPHHLSNEGRCATIVEASSAMLADGVDTPAAARARAGLSGGDARMRRALSSACGMGPALQAYTLMNLGLLTLKADRHVIRVVAPYLGLPASASPAAYEAALVAAQADLGMSPFLVDQIVWYTEASSDGEAYEMAEAALEGAEVPAASPQPRPTTPLVINSPRPTAPAPAGRGAAAGRRLIGTTIDIQPNGVEPRLELRFSSSDADVFPAANRSPIRLKIGETWWDGTIGRTAGNPPYVHSNLNAGDTKRSVTDLLRNAGVAERAESEFQCVDLGVLEMLRVVRPGAWRDGPNRGN